MTDYEKEVDEWIKPTLEVYLEDCRKETII